MFSQDPYAELFWRIVLASGVVSLLSVTMWPCAAGAVDPPAMTGVTAMVEGTSCMFGTGPNVVRMVTREDGDSERLGGATTRTTMIGAACPAAGDEEGALDCIGRAMSDLPHDDPEGSPRIEPRDRRARRDDPIRRVVDDGSFLEV